MKAILLAAAIAASGTFAVAETTNETLLVPPYPAVTPWKNISDQSNARMLMREWIPADQTEADIKDILTEQQFFNIKTTPAEFVKNMFARVGGQCANVRVNGPVEHVENGFAVAYAQIYCSHQKGTDKDVDIFLKAITGIKALYVVQYEIRRPADKNHIAGITEFSASQIEEMKSLLARQSGANKFLGEKVKLCASIDAAGDCTPGAASEAPKPADDDSAMFGFKPGTTTRAEVEKKLGRPTMENHMRPDAYSVVYSPRADVMVTCLFDKNDVLIRTRGYVKK